MSDRSIPGPIPGPIPGHVPVVIVGGGQAGLSMSWILTERGIRHLVLEANRPGHVWATERWDTFCLVTPNWQCRLPGFPYDGDDPDGFMRRDEIVDYLERYAASFEAPLRCGVTVRQLDRVAGGRFRLDTSDGPVTADQVVVATGGYHDPIVPRWAGALDPGLVQIHSSQYRAPAQRGTIGSWSPPAATTTRSAVTGPGEGSGRHRPPAPRVAGGGAARLDRAVGREDRRPLAPRRLAPRSGP